MTSYYSSVGEITRKHTTKTGCPSRKCWSWDFIEEHCVEKRSSNCFNLKCNSDQIIIEFVPELFGLDKNGSEPYPFGVKTACTPRWKNETNTWIWASSLGDCKMKTTTIQHK